MRAAKRSWSVAFSVALLLAAQAGATTTSREGDPVVAVRSFRFVDQSRLARFRDGTSGRRVLVTSVRFPLRGRGPFPLVVFGHGFASVPAVYARLLDSWASAGYVVAAPTFPVENANARGGPDESDLTNQPADISFVITRLLAASATGSGLARGVIDPTRIAVAGHSDGGETALAVAYDKPFLDRRVRAAIILSGAEIPGASFHFTPNSPPLLAAQGTADAINPPRYTDQFFRIAPRPKFLLTLNGAGHIQPYTTNSRQLAIVEDVTIAFLDCYLKDIPVSELLTADHAPAIARMTARP